MEKREVKLKELGRFIDRYNSFLILTHTNLDADAICSVLLISEYLKAKEKEYYIYSEDIIPDALRFIEGIERIKNSFPPELKFDAVIIVDCGDLGRIGRIEEEIKDKKIIINLDHHPYNTKFGQFNYIDVESSAVTEIIYDFFKCNDFRLNTKLATYIYIGILSDTNCLRNGNVTRKVFLTLPDLLNYNIDSSEIITKIFENYSENQVKLLGYILTNFNNVKGYGIYWAVIDSETMEKFNIKYSELNEIVNYLKIFKDINIAIIFKQIQENKYRINLRSKHGYNVADLALRFNGGGHKSAAACTVSGEINTIREDIIKYAKEIIDKGKK